MITSNTTSAITVEGTNLYTDTEFADGANLMRVYRRDSAVGNPFGFAGGWLVGRNYVDTGRFNRSVKQLWYFWNRHYEPEYLLRWLQPDPIGPWGDVAQVGCAYGYAASSPLAFTDPAGTTVRLPGGTRNHGAHDDPFVGQDASRRRQQLLNLFTYLLGGCGAAYAEEVPDGAGTRFELRVHVAHRWFTSRVNDRGCWCDCTKVLDYFERALDPSVLIGAVVGGAVVDTPAGGGGGTMEPNTGAATSPYDGVAYIGPIRAGTVNGEYAVTLAHEVFGHALPFAEGKEYNRAAIPTGNDFFKHLRCVWGPGSGVVIPPDRGYDSGHTTPMFRRDHAGGYFDPRSYHPNDPYPYLPNPRPVPRFVGYKGR